MQTLSLPPSLFSCFGEGKEAERGDERQGGHDREGACLGGDSMCVFWELSVYIDLYHACVCIYACIKPPAMGAHDDIQKAHLMHLLSGRCSRPRSPCTCPYAGRARTSCRPIWQGPSAASPAPARPGVGAPHSGPRLRPLPLPPLQPRLRAAVGAGGAGSARARRWCPSQGPCCGRQQLQGSAWSHTKQS